MNRACPARFDAVFVGAGQSVAVDARGYITTDDRLVTLVPHIWVLGDVNGRGRGETAESIQSLVDTA